MQREGQGLAREDLGGQELPVHGPLELEHAAEVESALEVGTPVGPEEGHREQHLDRRADGQAEDRARQGRMRLEQQKEELAVKEHEKEEKELSPDT